MSILWVLWVFIAVPLYFENKYFNINEAKAHAYTAGAIVMICLMMLCIRAVDFEIRSCTDLAMICLVCVALISCAFSGDIMVSFTGSRGWRIGGLTILTAVIIYFMIRRSVKISDRLGLTILGFNTTVFAVGIMHSAGIDVLHLHEHVAVDQYYSFLATIGNTNWYSGYLCLLIPAVLVRFLDSDKASESIVLLAFMVLAESNMILCGCDSIYMGIGLCMVFGIPYVVRRIERIRRIGILLVVYGTELLLIGSMRCFEVRLFYVHGVSGAMLRPEIALIIAITGLAIAVGLTYFRFDNYERSKAPVVITAVLEIAMAIVILAFVYDMVVHFDDSFGTYRGRTWKYSLWLYGDYGWGNRIIGVGPEMQWYDYKSLSNMFGRTILVSHSEPIQVLISMGAMGFACWAVIVSDRIAAYFRNKLWNSSSIMWFLPLAAYLGQSLVNSCQIMNLGILITIMAILDKELNECQST